MQEKKLFEYAVIRVVPRVEREEFMNAGVILFCAQLRFLKALYKIDEHRLKVCCADIDLHELDKRLKAIALICQGDEKGGPIAKLELPTRFRWLTATKSTVVQTSPVHPGLCTDASAELERLFTKLVD